MDVSQLQLQVDGVTRSFAEWSALFADTYYPKLGQQCYRVPGQHFNEQKLVSDEAVRGLQLQEPDQSKARGDLAHTLVVEYFEQVGQCLLARGSGPLFIISNLEYDNYLARLKAPGDAKERRKKEKAEGGGSNQGRDGTTVAVKEERSGSVKDRAGTLDDVEKGLEGNVALKDLSKMTVAEENSCVVRAGGWERADTKPGVEGASAWENISTADTDLKGFKSALHPTPDGLLSKETDVHSHSEISEHSSLGKDCPGQTSEQTHKITKRKQKQVRNKKRVLPTLETCTNKTVEGNNACGGVTMCENQKQQRSRICQDSSFAQTTKANDVGGDEEGGNVDDERESGGDDGARADVRSRGGPPETQRAIPPRPREMGKRARRGDIDILIASQVFGVVLVEVKSTGMMMEGPGWTPSEEERLETYRRVLRKADKQLTRAVHVFRYITPDLTPPPDITLVIALPFISRCQLLKILQDDAVKLSDNFRFLCNDDLKPQQKGEASGACTQPNGNAGGRTCLRDLASGNDALGSVCQWWDGNMRKCDSSLPLGHMKSIVGRICGLMSIVSVWTRTNPRVEVRTRGQAVSEVGSRVADIVLLPAQAALLAERSCTRVCLTGPMGSGKTLILQLKGRQWLAEGRRVVILNVRTSGRGRAVAYALEEAISGQDQKEVISMGTVERLDFAIVEATIDQLAAKLIDSGSIDNVCFLLDELTQQMFDFVQQLADRFRDCPIWCVAMFLHGPLEGFRHFRLGAVLRSPPSVQLLLRQLDLNPHHTDVYTTRSAPRGLPCDGPAVVLIQHRNHDTTQRPLYCVRCAEELADVLQDTLGLASTVQDTASPSEAAASGGRQPRPKAVEAVPLTFRDVLLLVGVPVEVYRPVGNGLFKAATEDVLKFCRHVLASPFLAGLKARGLPVIPVPDNTSKEIAVPSSDYIVLTDVTGSHGLERKVVFFLPGGPLFDDMGAEVGGGASSPGALRGLEQPFGNMFVRSAAEPTRCQPPSSNAGRGEDDNGEPRSAFGISACNRRFGMEVRGDSPALRAVAVAQRGCARGEGQEGEAHADAVFLTADVTDEVAGRREEVARLREAVSRLSMDDQDWLFVAAARCVAQFIFVVP